MDLSEYQRMGEMEEVYWWHRGKQSLIRTLLHDLAATKKKSELNILEIGCGTGQITRELQSFGNVWGLDTSVEAIEYCRGRGIKNLLHCDLVELKDDESLKGKFDVVLALDVLEHIQDDVEAIRGVRRVLADDGHFLVNVPAHKFLWSEHDEALHHRRRYSRKEIETKLRDNGFSLQRSSYFVSAFFPGIFLYRMYSSFFKKNVYPQTSYIMLPKRINDFMTRVLEIEIKMMRYFNLPIGSTINVIASAAELKSLPSSNGAGPKPLSQNGHKPVVEELEQSIR